MVQIYVRLLKNIKMTNIELDILVLILLLVLFQKSYRLNYFIRKGLMCIWEANTVLSFIHIQIILV